MCVTHTAIKTEELKKNLFHLTACQEYDLEKEDYLQTVRIGVQNEESFFLFFNF